MDIENVLEFDLHGLKELVTKKLNSRFVSIKKKKLWVMVYRKVVEDYRVALEQKIEIDRILKSQKESNLEDEDDFFWPWDYDVRTACMLMEKRNKGKPWWHALGHNPLRGTPWE